MNELGGYAFADLRVGMCSTFAKTITEADIVLFAAVSGDNNAIHINEEFAAGTIFKGRIAHGLLSASVISAAIANGTGSGVRLLGIGRDLDVFIQRQLRTELAGANYAGIQSDYYSRINQIFGEPGSQSALDTQFNGFINSLQTLATSPDSITARTQVLNQARGLAQQLNSMSENIQSLRGQAETEIGGAVNRVNELLENIEQISAQVAS